MKRSVLMLGAALYIAAAMMPGVAAAAPKEMSSGAPLDDPTLTPDVASKWKKATDEKDALLAAKHPEVGATTLSVGLAAATSTYGYHTLSATNFKQERTYFCGPAAARQSLSWHKARSGSAAGLPSQTTLGTKIGTTTGGSLTSKIAPALNSYNGTFGAVNYVASNITDTGSPTSAFYNRIGWMLEDARTVPIILTATSYIGRYRGHASRHYMSVSGINDTVSPIMMRSVDPNYDAAYYGVFWDDMGSTAATGLCRACYQADLGGSNLAMCW